MIDKDPTPEDPIDKWAHLIAIRLYRSHDKLVSFFPGRERNGCLAIFYCGAGIVLAFLDGNASGISLRPLYVVPVVLASLTSNHICATCVSIFIAIAHVISLRIALASSEEDFWLLWNFLPILISYLFLMETVRVLTRAMFDVLACNDALLERMVFLEIEKDQKTRDRFS